MKRNAALFFYFIILFIIHSSAFSQNISGERIQVSGESLTVLKFASKISRFEFDDKKNYSAFIRNNDNSLVIRTVGDNPDTTNLYVTEGKRGHWFIINYLKTIDINSTKLFYDYSDLKNLKKLVAQEQQNQANALASATSTDQAKKQAEAQEAKLDAVVAKASEDSVAAAKAEQARIAKHAEDLKKQQVAEQAKRKQFVEDSIAAKIAADARLAKAKSDSLNAKNAAEAQLAKAREDSIAAKKAEDARIAQAQNEARKQKALDDARLAKAKSDSVNAKNAAEAKLAKEHLDSVRTKKEEDARIAKAAEQAEQQRKTEEAKLAKQRADLIALQRSEEAKLAKQAELAKKQELAKLAAEKKKRLADSLAALPKIYTHLELWKKYPKIVFENPPPGQSLAADYFTIPDTVENSRVSYLILNNQIADDTLASPIFSDSDNSRNVVLRSIDFSGVNCYMRLLINNNSSEDYLVGQINLKWNQANGGNTYNLYPCYITSYSPAAFPVLAPRNKREIVLVTRAVNIKDEDNLILTIGDRADETLLRLTIPGSLYNEQMSIVRSVK